jgi:hypothetical protein
MTPLFDNLISQVLFESKKIFDTTHDDNPIVDFIGSKRWFKNGSLHRDNDLPAEVHPDGSCEWWQDGLRHRDNDLPAVMFASGERQWWQHSCLHREGDKPAITNSGGKDIWYKNGKPLSDSEVEELKCREALKRSLKDPADIEAGMKIFDL